MNKNRIKAIFLSVVVSLFALGGLAAPLASAATDPGTGTLPSNATQQYLEIPLSLTRQPPTFKPATATGCVTPCTDIATGIGVYGYISTSHTPETANFSAVTAIDTTNGVPDPKDVSSVLTPNYAVINGALRVYGLTIKHKYKITFIFEDAKSSDVQKFVGLVNSYCENVTFGQTSNVPASEQKAADVVLHLKYGCTRYNSEPFLPAAINPFIVNNDKPVTYTAAITRLAPETLQAPAPTNPSVVASDTSSDDCPLAAGAPLRWLGCPLIAIGASSVQALQGLIQQFLYTPVTQIFDNPGFKASANTFRILGISLVLITGLVMVISQAIGLELFDAYTVRKILPRLVVALIGMALAWPILRLVVIFFNDLGLWSSSLIGSISKVSTTANDAGLTGGVLSGAIVVTGGAAAVAALGFGGILSLLGTLILALLVGFIVLAIRQMIILVVVLMAPLAIAAYVLPGTQKIWHFWREALTTTLVMYPLIMIFLASGQALSSLLSATGSTTMTVLAVFVYFAPFFLLPFAFKLAGGLMSTIFSIANDRGRGGFDRLKKYRQGQSEQRMGYYKQKSGEWTMTKRAGAVRGLNDSASKRGRFAGGAMRLAGRQIGGLGGIEPRMSAINARNTKEMGDQIATGMDADARGLSVNKKAIDRMGWANALASSQAAKANGDEINELVRENKDDKGNLISRQYKSLGGSWINESDVINGHKKWGNNVAAQQAALSYEMRKAMTDEEVAGISTRYNSLARDQWGQSKGEAAGSWIGASFENQNQHLEFKNTDSETGQLNVEKFSKEAYEKKGSYQLSQMSGHTIKQLENAYVAADLAGDTASKERLQAVAESFMSRYGSGGGIVGMEGETPIEANAPPGTRAGNYQSNSQGSAHVAQAVRSFAEKAGVYRPEGPKGPDSTGAAPTIKPLN